MSGFAEQKQMMIENKYSRHLKRKIITDSIKYMDFCARKSELHELLREYVKGDYYDSKNRRIRYLRDNFAMMDVIDELIIIVIPEVGEQPIQAVASKLAAFLEYDDIYDGIKTASEIIAIAASVDLYDIIMPYASSTGALMIESLYELDEDTIQKLENLKYLPPMICEPRPITDNNCSGYLTKSESVILGSQNHHEEPQALDVLNICGKIPLALDKAVLALEEKPKKELDTEDKMANWLRMIISSREVYKELLLEGNMFYLNWRFDKRGRIYSQGYHVNIQSTSYKKALINLHKKEVITC